MTTKQTFRRTLAAIAAMLLAMPATMWADSTFGGGSGTQADPYKIYNASHFVQLSDEVKAGNTFEGVYFKLLNSVDFKMWGQIPPIGGQYYTEDGATGNRRFCGYFLGNNCTLYNVTITENPDNCGIFGYLGYGGYVSDLTIDGNSTITGIGVVGAVVGYADRNTYIYNCKVGENVTVKVHPDAAGSAYWPSDFGGIVGTTLGNVADCVSKATVTVNDINKASKLGGIAGNVGSSGKVEFCYSLGKVDGTNNVGDIAGSNNGTVSYNYYHCTKRNGGVNGTDTDGAQWMGTVTWAEGVSGNLPSATYTDGNTPYFANGKYMLMTLDYSVPEGYIMVGDTIIFKANEAAIGKTERAGKPYYEFTMPDQDVTISAVTELKRDIAYSPWVRINIPSLIYTGEQLTPDVQATDIKDGDNVPLSLGQDFSLALPDEIVNAGEYTATLNGMGSFAGSVDVTFTVEPAESDVRIITAPAAIEGLVYNGKAQVLITPGEVENGTMVYKLGDGEYSTELPSATAMGTYVIYYKAYSDGNHKYTAEQSLEARIGQPESSTWAGEGTKESPYLISSVIDMNRIALMQNEMDYTGVYFSLVEDLDYDETEYLIIGTLSRRFKGNFNGNNHVIKNVVINKPNENDVALFGVLGNEGVVANLHLGEGSEITGADVVGGIAGLSSGSIVNCTTASGVVITANEEAGGILGRNVGIVDRCVNRASVSSNKKAGGIAGSAYSSPGKTVLLTNNLNFGSVIASNNKGGVVGYNFSAEYSNNYYAGACTAEGINGSDDTGRAMRGYSISGGETVNVEIVDNATVGVAFEDVVYAGNEQEVILKLSSKLTDAQNTHALRAASTTNYVASAGNLGYNGDGTWTLIMTAENVTISVEGIVSGLNDIHATRPKSGQRYNLMGQPVGNDYKGIVIEDGKKFIVR